MNKYLEQIIMSIIVITLLTISNKVFELYPSAKFSVIIFDLVIAFVLLKIAFKRLSA